MLSILRKLFGFRVVSPTRSAISMPEAAYRVSYHDGVFTCCEPNGNESLLPEAHLVGVVIETNDLGPFAPDVYWVLLSDEKKHLIFPMGASGETGILDELLKLEGFDHEAMIQAMSYTKNQTFLCWQKPNSSSE